MKQKTKNGKEEFLYKCGKIDLKGRKMYISKQYQKRTPG